MTKTKKKGLQICKPFVLCVYNLHAPVKPSYDE